MHKLAFINGPYVSGSVRDHVISTKDQCSRMQSYPNPLVDHLTLNLSSSKHFLVQIVNIIISRGLSDDSENAGLFTESSSRCYFRDSTLRSVSLEYRGHMKLSPH